MEVRTLNDFYELMFSSKNVRSKAVQMLFQNESISLDLIEDIKKKKVDLTLIPKEGNLNVLLHDGKKVLVEISYEKNEMEKDLIYLNKGEMELVQNLTDVNVNFEKDYLNIYNYLKNSDINNFLTDRDGTVNNYCGRYKSSIQSIYNAYFLTQFARKKTKNSTILTSAPLENVGLVDISVAPQNLFVYAGSKGREYYDKNGEKGAFPVPKIKQDKLDILNKKLGDLLKQPKFQIFSMIGSGLQYKFGQTTVARQDINGSVSEDDSKAFLDLMTSLVSELDPEKKFFIIEDTGKDIEIILTVDSSKEEDNKDFDKGDGVKFLNDALNLNMQNGVSLICGDTSSDIPMVTKTLEINPEIKVIFVTNDEGLKTKLLGVYDKSLIVSSPDSLVYGLYYTAKNC